jgi:hypothetical protein
MAGGEFCGFEHRLIWLGWFGNDLCQFDGLIPGQLPVGFRFDDAICSFCHRILNECRNGDPA